MPLALRNARARIPDGERHDRQTHGNPIPDVCVHTLELLRRREIGRVIVAQRDLHGRVMPSSLVLSLKDTWFAKLVLSELALRRAQGERVEGLTTSGYRAVAND